MTVVGVAVGRGSVRAVARRGQRVVWAGQAEWAEPSDLRDAIRGLAAELPRRPARVRIVLERDLLQIRHLATRSSPCDLESAALFRENGVPLVTTTSPRSRGGPPVAVAAEEPVVGAVLEALSAIGWDVSAVGAGPEAVARAYYDRTLAVVRSGEGWELVEPLRGRLVRSRLVRRLPEAVEPSLAPAALASLGAHAAHFVAAYGATLVKSAFVLTTPSVHARAYRRAVRHAVWGAVAATLALAALAGAYASRLAGERAAIARTMASLGPRIEEARTYQQELAQARQMLEAVASVVAAPSQLARLEEFTAAFSDSAFLTALECRADGQLLLAGYAANASQALARLAGIPGLTQPRLTGAVGREGVAGRVRERFAIAARWTQAP